MRNVLGCCVLLSAGLWAQSTAQLDRDLAELARHTGSSAAARTQQVANGIYGLAKKDAQPSRQSVLDFDNVLAEIMAGFSLDETPKVEKIKPATQVRQSGMCSKVRASVAVSSIRPSTVSA